MSLLIAVEIALGRFQFSLIFVGIVGFASIFILTYKRVAFPYLLIFVLGLEQFQIPFLNLAELGTISKFGGGILLICYLLSRQISGHTFFTKKISARFVPLIAYILYSTMSLQWSNSPQNLLLAASTYILIFMLALMVIDFIEEQSDLKHFIWALFVYAFFVSLSGIYQVYSGRLDIQSANTLIDQYRANLLGNANDIAAHMAMGVGLILSVFGLKRNNFIADVSLPIHEQVKNNNSINRLLLIAQDHISTPFSFYANSRLLVLLGCILPIIIIGILTTGSRGGIVALICAVILVTPRTIRQPIFPLTIFTSLFLVLVAYFVFPEPFIIFLDRFNVDLSNPEAASGERLTMLRIALSIFSESPIWGSGLTRFQFHPKNPFGIIAHGSLQSILAEGGIIGITLFISGLVLTFHGLIRSIQMKAEPVTIGLRDIAYMLFISLGTLCVAFIFLDGQADKIFWILLALSNSTIVMTQREMVYT
mgnify:CR=1 FL=1